MNIDITKLSRDYQKEPLSSKEIINKEDLVELYMNQNLTTRDIMKLFHIGADRVIFWLKHYGIKKNKEEINKRISETLKSEESKQKFRISNLQNCGYENPAQNPINIAKAKETRKQRYGDENFNNRKKTEQTCEQKYGYSHPMKSPEVRKKVDDTCIIKYGNRCSAQGKEQREQAEKKNERLYGAKNVFASPIIKEKIKQIINTPEAKQRKSEIMRNPEVQKKIYEKKKINHTLWRDFWSDPKYKDKLIKNKIKTNRERYGVDHYFQTKECQSKSYKTKKERGGFNTSKEEQIVFLKLLNKFPDTQSQYRSDKYPFNCDFYIPSKDLYIEYNGTWTHGGKPFDINNKIDLQKALLWLERAKEINFKNENKQYYLNAYNVWTKTDIRKRETAKRNKLNWIEFFNMEQFDKWIKRQSSYNIDINIEKEMPRLFELCRREGFKILERGANGLIYKYHHSIWDCKTLNSRFSPREAFDNDKMLMNAIKNMCRYMPHFIYRDDVVHKICQRFSIAKIAKPITIFKPSESLRLLKKYAHDSELIVNPMSGFSAHLIASHKLGIRYEGYDLNPITVAESQKMIVDYKMNATIAVEDILSIENIKEYSGKTTLICCPPYLNNEGKQLEMWGQPLANIQSNQWCIEILKRYNCDRYIFITNKNEGLERYTVEIKDNGAVNKHINSNTKQFIIVLNRQQRKEIIL